jgi:DNA-binding beta-propeller fold protein YncE
MKRARWILVIACLGCSAIRADEFVMDSIAGSGAPENNGDAGLARLINIGDPFGVEIGPDGTLYVTEVRNHRMRRIDLTTGKITTVAGSGQRGYSGDGGPAIEAELNEPYEVRFDREGNMFFVEMQNHIIRRVDRKTNTITTVAGNGRKGFAGDGRLATEAMLNQPHSIALDENDGLYVADIGNHRIRRVNLRTGIIESIAGNSERKFPHDGQAARGNPILGPRALYVDGDILWIALREGHSIWRLDLSDGILHHIAGTGRAGFSGDHGPARQATFNGPKGIAVGPDDSLYVADTENNAIRKIDLGSGTISTIAGSPAPENNGAVENTPDAQARLNRPHGVCVGPGGRVYIGDTLNHRVRRLRSR